MALFELKLADERTIAATRVLVCDTYAGMLEGYPCTPINDSIVARVAGEAEQALGSWPVRVIEPPRTVSESDPPGPFGPEERLPGSWIAATFDSGPIASDDEEAHASCAIVVWFQQHPFPFPDESVMLRLRNLSWVRFAKDFGY